MQPATTTPLREAQLRAGAEFGECALPVHFGDTIREYRAARQTAALLDRSAFGRLRISGADSLDLLNRLSTNKLTDVEPGHGAATVLTTNKGRVIDLLGIANLGDELLVITSPGTQERVVEWIDLYTFGEDVAVEDATESTAMLTVIGPAAAELLGAAASGLDLFDSAELELNGELVTLVRTDALGVAGFDVVAPAEHAAGVWMALVDRGSGPHGRAGGGDAPRGAGRAPIRPRARRGVQPAGGGPTALRQLRQGVLHRPGGGGAPQHLQQSAKAD